MTEEEKQLLLKDLCGRLPYRVKVRYSSYYEFITCTLDTVIPKYKCVDLWSEKACFTSIFIDKIKPYLYPLSSMTDEQKEIYCQLQQKVIYNSKGVVTEDVMNYVNWCYENHLDVNDLIPNNLAIDCTGLNIY